MRLDENHINTVQIFDSSNHAAPAALSNVPIFLSGAINTRMPNPERWVTALLADSECVMLSRIANNPGERTTENIESIHHTYWQSVRDGLVVDKKDGLYLKEVLKNDTKFVKLRIVLHSLRNLVFVAFHSNPIGGHLNAYRTYFCIRM